MGWHALACRRTATVFYDALKNGKGDAMTSHFDKRPYNSSHHITQEAVSGDLEAPSVGFQLMPLGMGKVADGGLHIGSDLAETGKVVL